MSMKDYLIEIAPREELGKRDVRRLRKDGFIPGIYYAPDQKQAMPFKVDAKELRQALHSDALVYRVNIGDQRKNVLIKEIQYHPVTDEILHVDFKGVHMDESVEVKVPIHIIGRATGVKDEGGQLHQTLMELDIRCLASAIPPHFEVDISALHLGDTIHAGDVELGGAELVNSPDSMVISVAHPRGPEVEEEAEVEEGEFAFDEGEEPSAKESEPTEE